MCTRVLFRHHHINNAERQSVGGQKPLLQEPGLTYSNKSGRETNELREFNPILKCVGGRTGNRQRQEVQSPNDRKRRRSGSTMMKSEWNILGQYYSFTVQLSPSPSSLPGAVFYNEGAALSVGLRDLLFLTKPDCVDVAAGIKRDGMNESPRPLFSPIKSSHPPPPPPSTHKKSKRAPDRHFNVCGDANFGGRKRGEFKVKRPKVRPIVVTTACVRGCGCGRFVQIYRFNWLFVSLSPPFKGSLNRSRWWWWSPLFVNITPSTNNPFCPIH